MRLFSQCAFPAPSNALLRQPDLYQLIGNSDSAYDAPNGVQGIPGGYSLNDGNWLNRGNVNLIINGDFTLPGTTARLSLPNGTGGTGAGTIELPVLPGWTITGNSVMAYPFYAFNLTGVAGYAVSDYGASPTTVYLGNSSYVVTSETPVFDHGYVTNGNSVNPHLNSQGINAGHGQNTGYPIALEQTISTQVDSLYRLQFYITGESTSFLAPGLMGLDISGYDRSILFVPGDSNKIRYEFQFKAKSNNTIIRFINWGHLNVVCTACPTEFVIDDVIVNFVPFPCTVVPVKFNSFTANQQDNNVVLFWETVAEQNSSYFNIQFSSDAANWKSLGHVQASGFSNILKKYSFVHKDPPEGINYYRIRQLDYDGKSAFTEIKHVEIAGKDDLTLINDGNNLMIKASANLKINAVSIYSSNGQMVFQIKNEYSAKINIGRYKEFLPGLYYLHIHDANGRLYVKKVIKP